MSTNKLILYDALIELSQSISGHSDLNSLCFALAKSLKRIVGFDDVVLLLYDASSNSLRINGLVCEESDEGRPRTFPVNNTAAGWVWANQQPLFIGQLNQETHWPELSDLVRTRGLASLILLPLTSGAYRLGVLSFAFITAPSISEEEMAFICRVASEFTVTIESYLARQECFRERDRLQVLFDITKALISKPSPEALISAVWEQLSKAVAFDVSSLILLDDTTGDLSFSNLRIAESLQINPGITRASPDELRSAKAIATGKPVVVESDFGSFASPIFKDFAAAGFHSGCSIPLIMPNAVIGTLELARMNNCPFTEDDVELLVQIANQTAIALQNSLAYRKLAELKERLATEKLYLENDIRVDQNLGGMLGESPAFQAVLENIQIVAPTDSTVLILGETGTGKELVARRIHELSGRSKHGFVKVNCAAIPPSLLESELFGHEKGAFTGAVAQRIGRFELAHQGTLFLDEVAEIPLQLQSKLLRVIQEQEFERVGGSRTIRVSVRIVSASNRNLKAMVDQGDFRSDLYYRLHVFPICIPPLRDRRRDIPLLTRYFTQKYAQRMGRQIDSISSVTLDTLTRYQWPGNIRELQNVIERSVILTQGRVLNLAMSEIGAATPPISSSEIGSTTESERIRKALKDANGIVSGPNGAARLLGLKRTTLQARMKRLQITRA